MSEAATWRHRLETGAAAGRGRYRLSDPASGEAVELSPEELARVIGAELGYIDWVIACDGAFENGRWRVEACARA